MITEHEKIFNIPDGTKLKLFVKVALFPEFKYLHVFFISAGDGFWSSIPEDAARYFIDENQIKEVEVELWKMLKPV